LVVLPLKIRDQLQVPINHFRTAGSLDRRQSLQQIVQVAGNVMQFVFQVMTPDVGTAGANTLRRQAAASLEYCEVIDRFPANAMFQQYY